MRPYVIAALVAVALAGGGVALWFATRDTEDPEPPHATAPTPGLPWFVDKADAAGIDFVHFDPATPNHYIQETMGSGVAWIEYDADGWPDLFCVQDGPVRPTPALPPTGGEPAGKDVPSHKLYRNRRDGTFEDVTERVGLARGGFGMGAAVGDYDGDGFDDLLVTYLGGIELFRNVPNGGGRRFENVTA